MRPGQINVRTVQMESYPVDIKWTSIEFLHQIRRDRDLPTMMPTTNVLHSNLGEGKFLFTTSQLSFQLISPK